jgi:glycosyltransferase involved in cell wall biosynthesis
MRACGYREELIRVVPNGVPSGPELTARETPSGTWTLSMVALFRPRKGLEVLLHALAELRAQQVPVRLRAIGPFETPEYEATIRELVAELGLEDAIDWIGFTREVNRELAQTDLFVLPSLFGEGLPMVVLEAMAAGVPVIGTAIEGIPEAIRDGVDGLIAAPSDAASLASAIRRVIEGEVDWQALRASARLRQVALFSDHSMATGVAQVYRELLA